MCVFPVACLIQTSGNRQTPEVPMTDNLLTEQDAAPILGMSIAWLQRKRWEGGGPPYVKFDRAVRYRESDLNTWIAARICKNTSDQGGQND
jgi:predicted DNA-binding transcriptional regulator AlpA